MGGTLRRRQSAQTRHLQAGQRGRRGTHKCLEHPTATSLLPLERISKSLFVIYIPNTLVGCTNVNSIELIKSKGDSAFPWIPSPSRGLLRPPPKWPVFSKIHRKCAKCASTQTLGELTWDASSQRVKKHESGIAHASSRIRPFPLAALPTSYSCERNLPSQGSPKKMGKAEQHNCRNK
jgi:hypothetical protein